jgi:NADH-quinone oxidoreductase subunit G
MGVNGHWMCNEGRDLYQELAATKRPAAHRLHGQDSDLPSILSWLGEVLEGAKKSKGERFAAVAGSWMSNEEAFLFANLVGKQLKCGAMDVKTDRTRGLPADDLLHTDDHNPNRFGVVDAGCVPGKKDGLDLAAIAAACTAGEIDTLLIWGAGLQHHFDSYIAMAEALSKVANVVQITDTEDAVSPLATAVISLRSWAESNGTWTNFEGHHSRFKKALRPPKQAVDGFELLMQVHDAAGIKPPVKSLLEARKKLKQDPDTDARDFASGQFEFPHQTLYRHTSGVLEV